MAASPSSLTEVERVARGARGARDKPAPHSHSGPEKIIVAAMVHKMRRHRISSGVAGGNDRVDFDHAGDTSGLRVRGRDAKLDGMRSNRIVAWAHAAAE
jgi:hypothetical protein